MKQLRQRGVLGLLGLLWILAWPVPATAAAQCTVKQQNLERQIHYAKAHGNAHRVRGLQRALARVKARCGVSSTPQASAAPGSGVAQQQAWHEIEVTKQRLRVQQRQMDVNQALGRQSVPQAAWLRWQLQQEEAGLAKLLSD